MNANMQAIGAANLEAVLRIQSVDSITSLQETLGEAGLPQKGRALWTARWSSVLVGQTTTTPSPVCSDIKVIPLQSSCSEDDRNDDLTLVEDVSNDVEIDRRRLEGADSPGSLASMVNAPQGGLRCRPARMSALLLQAAAANRSAAKSVPKTRFWATLSHGPQGIGSRYVDRGGIFNGLSVARL